LGFRQNQRGSRSSAPASQQTPGVGSYRADGSYAAPAMPYWPSMLGPAGRRAASPGSEERWRVPRGAGAAAEYHTGVGRDYFDFPRAQSPVQQQQPQQTTWPVRMDRDSEAYRALERLAQDTAYRSARSNHVRQWWQESEYDKRMRRGDGGGGGRGGI